MKKICVMLMTLLLLSASAYGEAYTIGEVRAQVKELGRWTQTYIDDYGREVEVDIVPIIPDVESVPVLTVEKPEYTVDNVYNVCNPSLTTVRKLDVCTELEYTKKETNEKWYVAIASTAMKNIVIMYENLDTKIKKTTKDLESLSGRIYCSNEVDRTKAYFDGYNMTIQDCIDMANERLQSFFPEYGLDLDLMWVKIVPNTRPCYYCDLRQELRGIPILMGASDPVRYLYQEEIDFERPESWNGAIAQSRWGVFFSPSWAYISYVDGAYQISFDPLKEKKEIISDIPLAKMETVIKNVEKRINRGNIRNIYAMRFGYCCYVNEEDETILYPIWEIECDYFYHPKEEAENLPGIEEALVTESYYYNTMIINAQTGEFMDPIELKENLLDCPEIITWEEVQTS